jgi:hypothetical protein
MQLSRKHDSENWALVRKQTNQGAMTIYAIALCFSARSGVTTVPPNVESAFAIHSESTKTPGDDPTCDASDC